MPLANWEIADLFDELADLLEIEDSNPFRVRAYRNAARTVREHPQSFAALVDAGKPLPKLPGIGKDLASKIVEAATTGKLEALEEVATRTPPALSDLMKIQGLGAKRVKALYHELEIRSLEDLRRALDNGKIHTVRGFGPKTEELIRERLPQALGEERIGLAAAEGLAAPLVEYLRASNGIEALEIAGSYRRRRATVGDLDVVAAARDGAAVIERFADYDAVDRVLSKGSTRATVRLVSGLQVDLRVVEPKCFGAALVYFTGSKQHNIELRKIAIAKGYKLNEYGLFEDERLVAGKTETEVYKKLGLVLVPAELRENRGEIEAARNKQLPKLVTLDDLRGDLHCHTNASDGRDTLERMARAAAERGYEYLSINDHSQRLTVAHGLDAKRVLAQIKAIDKLNAKLDGLVILKSIEVDILEDGALDLPASVLDALDFTVCSVHSQFELPRAKQTERILRAMDDPHCNVLAHPTGRKLGERKPVDVDLETILEGARERGCVLEINAHPERLDLDDEACRLAKQIGCKLSLGTDAHAAADLDYMRYGLDQARRGWLEPGDIVNTLPLAKLMKVLART